MAELPTQEQPEDLAAAEHIPAAAEPERQAKDPMEDQAVAQHQVTVAAAAEEETQ